MLKLLQLSWTGTESPNEDIRYHHVIAETPLGRISIEWKGWKEYPTMDAVMPWSEQVVGGPDLDDMKEQVRECWDKMILRLVEL